MKTLIFLASTSLLLAIGVVSYVRETRTRQELENLKASVAEIARASTSNSQCTCSSSSPSDVVTGLRALAVAAVGREAEVEAAPAPPPPSEPTNSLPETLEEVQEAYRSAYAKEGKDPAWSRESESKLTSMARSSVSGGSRLLSVDCRTTMCMMEVAHASADTANAHGVDSWMMKLLRDWGGGGVFVAGERQQGNEIVQTLIPLSAAFSSKSL
jgi:hypothetical protein